MRVAGLTTTGAFTAAPDARYSIGFTIVVARALSAVLVLFCSRVRSQGRCLIDAPSRRYPCVFPARMPLMSIGLDSSERFLIGGFRVLRASTALVLQPQSWDFTARGGL